RARRADDRRGECLRRGGRASPAPEAGPASRTGTRPAGARLPGEAQPGGGRLASPPPRGRSPVRWEPDARNLGLGASEGDARGDQRRPPDGVRHVQAEARSMIGPAHHVGIAVKSLQEALEGYRRMPGATMSTL